VSLNSTLESNKEEKKKDLVARRLSSLSHSGVRLSIDACRLREGSGFRVQGSGFRVQGSGFRVEG